MEAGVLEQTELARLRGRGLVQMLNGGAGVVGAVLAGTIAVAIGMRETFWIPTVGGIVAAAWLLHPSIRRRGVALLVPRWFPR